MLTLIGEISPMSATATVQVPGPGVTFVESATKEEKLPERFTVPVIVVGKVCPHTVGVPLDPAGGFQVSVYVPL